MRLGESQRREFAERGFVVVPAVLGAEAIAAGMAVVDAAIRKSPPPVDHRGHHFYWPRLEADHPLRRLLVDTGALAVADALIAPGRLELSTQAQIALNIPPYPHAPGRGHIDGATPPEPDGRPGTFTMLAAIFLTDQTDNDMGNCSATTSAATCRRTSAASSITACSAKDTGPAGASASRTRYWSSTRSGARRCAVN